MGVAVIYCRISKDATGQGLGVERQELECRQLARRLRLTVADVLVDNDISAYSGRRRPAYERLLAGVRDGRWDAVLAWNIDRITRSMRDLADFTAVLEQAAVPMHTVAAGDYDFTDETGVGEFTAHVFGAIAARESRIRSARIKAKWQQKAATGLPHNGYHAPYGYERDGVTVNPAEAAAVRWMYDRMLDGWSVNRVALEMPTPPRLMKAWSTQAIRYVLRNRRNIGLRVHKGVVVGEGVWPAIVDTATFEAVQDILDQPWRLDHGARASRNRGESLLSGLVFDSDGFRMYRARIKHRAVYRTGAYSHLQGGTRMVQIEMGPLDDHVSGRALEHVAELATVAPPADDDPALVEVAALEDELSALSDMKERGEIPFAEYRRQQAATRARLEEARTRLPRRRVVFDDDATLPDKWDQLDHPARRAALHRLIERVVVKPSTMRGIHATRPDVLAQRIAITWAD